GARALPERGNERRGLRLQAAAVRPLAVSTWFHHGIGNIRRGEACLAPTDIPYSSVAPAVRVEYNIHAGGNFLFSAAHGSLWHLLLSTVNTALRALTNLWGRSRWCARSRMRLPP